MKLNALVTALLVFLAAGSGVARAADGAAVYKGQCAKCHGDNGRADSPAAKAMKAPALAGNASIVAAADADLVKKIRENKKHATLKSLSDDDLAAAVAFVKGLASGK
jgi:mono/diheme cytochrome c family protein